MKNIILPIIALATIAVMAFSCNQPSSKHDGQLMNDTSVPSEIHVLPESTKTDTEPSSTMANADQSEKGLEKEFSIASIVNEYLALKNALVADNDKAAANAGKQLFNVISKVDITTVPLNKQKEYMHIAGNAKENAEQIGNNSGKIDYQRQQLASLSKDVSDLIALFGTAKKLYLDYCPMYNDGKGATWISESKIIKNPYYGSQMLTCGSVKKEW